MTKGKFDWKTNTVFSELVEMNKMSRQDAEKELGNYVQIQDADKSEARESYDENETGEFNKSNDFQDILKKEFLQYRSMKLQDLDVTHTIQLLQDILELKEQGRKAKSEEDFINRHHGMDVPDGKCAGCADPGRSRCRAHPGRRCGR